MSEKSEKTCKSELTHEQEVSLTHEVISQETLDTLLKNTTPQSAVIGQHVMDGLRERIGQVVLVITSELCNSAVQVGTLKEVKNFESITLHDNWLSRWSFPFRVEINFVAREYAIKKIFSFNGDVLYDNLFIPRVYGKRYSDQHPESIQRYPRSKEEVVKFKTLSFGL